MTGINYHEMSDLWDRIRSRTPSEQMYLLERIAKHIRDAHFTDHEAIERGLDAMAADPAIQHEIALWNRADTHAAR